MNKEIRMRKRRFRVFFLVLALVLSHVVAPITAMAAEHSVFTDGEANTLKDKILEPGDVMNFKIYSSEVTSTINYYDLDNTLLYGYENEETGTKNSSHEIKSYMDADFLTDERFMPEAYFKGWKVTYASLGSGNALLMVNLQAVPYEPGDEFNINYVLDGGTNSNNNPSSYVFGTGVANFEDATKDGYVFKGWYGEASFDESSKVTSIPAEATGDKTLYAKFEPETYAIQYELDGGTNSVNNPNEYAFGVGVASFEDATKDGYTFKGWYSDNSFEESKKVTSIAASEQDAVTLYAKFEPKTYAIQYELDGGTNSANNPTGYVYGVGVGSFENAQKDGYTFEGWYKDAAFTQKVTSIEATQTGEITLYAKYMMNEVVKTEPKQEQAKTVKTTKKVTEKKKDTSGLDEDTPRIGSDADDGDDAPETGDDAPISLLLIIMLMSAVGVSCVVVRYRKRSR